MPTISYTDWLMNNLCKTKRIQIDEKAAFEVIHQEPDDNTVFWFTNEPPGKAHPTIKSKTIIPDYMARVGIEGNIPKPLRVHKSCQSITLYVEDEVCDLRGLPSYLDEIILVGSFKKVMCSDRGLKRVKLMRIQSPNFKEIDLPRLDKLSHLFVRNDGAFSFNIRYQGFTRVQHIIKGRWQRFLTLVMSLATAWDGQTVTWKDGTWGWDPDACQIVPTPHSDEDL